MVLDALFQWLDDVLASHGIHLGVGTLETIVWLLLGAIVVTVLYRVGHTIVEYAIGVVEWVRHQIQGRFWRDAGKLATFLSFALLVIGYGLYWREQPRTLGAALQSMVRDHLAEIVPTAILTQVLLLCGYWIVFGRLTGVKMGVLLAPYRLFLGFAGIFGLLVLASVVPFALAGGHPEPLGVATLALISCVPLPLWLLGLLRRWRARATARVAPALLIAGITWLYLTALVAVPIALAYAQLAKQPSVTGLLRTDADIMTVALLLLCYKFRAYIGGAEVPKSIGHFIDFSLAVSACAIAVAGAASTTVAVGRVPPIVIAVIPALIVAGMLFIVHVRPSRSDTHRWATCLAVALVAGLLAGPVKQLLAGPIGHLAVMLPINWG
ncbi:MAG: hypothetical protein J2P15_15855 [Micromonosporaceae bacterium]|nr:hypothetical protein [Micromonosporaceae bacterium]